MLFAITANLDYDIRDFFIGPYTQQIVNHSKIHVLSIKRMFLYKMQAIWCKK